MIEMRNIAKRYGAVRALDDVSLSIRSGEVIALAGENGSGKSTLMKVLAGAVVPDGGQLTFNDEEVSFATPLDALDRGIALVAQELTVVPSLPVYENVMLPMLRHRPTRMIDRAAQIKHTSRLLTRLGREDIDPRRPVERLGPVEQTYVEIAKALVTDPRVLILDEATSRLGVDEVGDVLALIRRLRDEGLSTVMITHRIAEMTSTADRAVVLRDGKYAGELDRSELNERQLVRLMVGRDIEAKPRSRQEEQSSAVLAVREVVVAGSQAPVSLTVGAGEVVGLAGLVGSGRTELLEGVFGARRRSGSVEVSGQRVVPASVRRARRSGLSLVPEERRGQGLIVSASIEDNYLLGGLSWWQLFRRRRARKAARAAISSFGVKASSVQAGVSTLSGGNQQKVVIARALSTAPQVLLLDEPTRGVDVGAREDIYGIVSERVAQGMGVLLASSDMVEILSMSDRVLVMHEHAIVGELHGDRITEHNIALLSAGGRLDADVND